MTLYINKWLQNFSVTANKSVLIKTTKCFNVIFH